MSTRILLVDNNPEDLKRLHEHFESEGYEVEEAEACPEACNLITSGEFDLVVLDATKPDEVRADLCRDLHGCSSTAGVPIIGITDHDSAHRGEAALEIGADDFVVRPIKKSELLVRARTLLRLKELNDDLRHRNELLEDLNQQLASRNQELEQGMEMAHRLQEALLPQHYPPLKNISFYHLYTPADVIGGDIFQITKMEDGRAVIFLSDVSGHGIRAALVTSILKAVFEHVYLEDKDVTEILEDLNSRFRSILGDLSPHIYATGFLLIVDGEECTIDVACAGHVSPFLISKYDMSCRPLLDFGDIGPALGFFQEPQFPSVGIKLSPGDIVLGFTDGVYEAINDEGEIFGLERMRQFIARNARLIPRDLIQKVVTHTDEYRGSHKRSDDVCLVALEVH
ncbi:MAG: SpoIIE family protein phosphatase [Candidatus Brocadiia bacterium]